ncbi:SitI3 family protein [Gandjariella thermophila]|uniref:Uncharacterized protein n=1 Tax=Gandjariella thermophila TaxID=1931992 RepID=A0A4D4JI46_9PSEU|nr:SitI3 family protein [Gandjariella thermophila]GDY34086.1 hypothetical protein GTS_57190 [Gandjariella thermophila]
MAIVYYLDMATPFTAEQVALELYDSAQTIGLFDESVTVEKILKEGAVTKLWTWIKVTGIQPQPWNVIITDLGFTPTVSVAFRRNNQEKTSQQEDDMVRIVDRLLVRVPGDLVLHWDFEEIWLLRRGGELTVSEDDDIWPPERLAVLTQPYHRATHTFS